MGRQHERPCWRLVWSESKPSSSRSDTERTTDKSQPLARYSAASGNHGKGTRPAGGPSPQVPLPAHLPPPPCPPPPPSPAVVVSPPTCPPWWSRAGHRDTGGSPPPHGWATGLQAEGRGVPPSTAALEGSRCRLLHTPFQAALRRPTEWTPAASPVHSLGFWFQSQFPMSSSPSSPCEWGTGPGPETPARHGADGEERPGPEEAWGAPASGSPVHVLTATVQTGRAWGRGQRKGGHGVGVGGGVLVCSAAFSPTLP